MSFIPIKSFLTACLLLFFTPFLFGQCQFEDLFGPVNYLAAPTFFELPVIVPDQDSRSSFNCETPSSGIDLGEYVEIEMTGTTIESFSLVGTSTEWFVNGTATGTNSGNSATLGSFTGVAQLANQISNPANCDPIVASNRNIPNENIELQCLDCPVIPSTIPQQALDGGLDSVYFSNSSFFSFSNYPSEGTDPLGAAASPNEIGAWHFLYNPGFNNLLAIHRGNRIPIYPAQELLGTPDDPVPATVLRVTLRNFAFNAPGWFDNYLGLSIINSNGVQNEVLWSTMFPASNTVDFNLPLSLLEPTFSGDYSIQFWTTFDWVNTFGCNDYSFWPGNYVAFEVDISNYTPPSPPSNDECVDATLITPDNGSTCTTNHPGTFSFSTESATQSVLDNCTEEEDVWYQFVATSTQYDLSAQLLSGTGTYHLQLLKGTNCSNLSSERCELVDTEGTFRLVDLEIGSTYYLRFVRDLLDEESLDFEFCIRSRTSTCLIPQVEVVENCLNNEFYELVVTVSDLRNNSGLQLLDITQPEPLPPVLISSVGTYSFGPIPVGVNFTMQVSADESDCDLIFGDFLPDCSLAPPPNNTCVEAQVLEGCFTRNFATATSTQNSCELSTAADVWFSFVPNTSVQEITLEVAAEVNDADVAVEVFLGECGNLSSVYCASGRAHLLNGLSTGQPHLLLLKLPAGFEDLTVCRQGYEAPTNETCQSAASLSVSMDCNPLSYSNIGASPSASPLACQAANSADVWFSFLATTNTAELTLANIIPWQDTHTGQLVLSVYGSDCGSLNELACTTFDFPDGGAYTLTNLFPGQQYWLRVSASAFEEYFDFDICLTGTPVPDNDICENAVAIPVSSDLECLNPLAGNTQAAITPGAEDCDGNPVQDVWYSFVAGNAQHALVVNSQDFPQVQVYSGACGVLMELNGCEVESTIQLSGLTPDERYYLRVMSSAGFAAEFSLCILTLPGPPANDECASASVLTAGAADCSQTVGGTFLSATANDEDCFASPLSRDVWYQFTATESSQVLLVSAVEDALQTGQTSFATLGYEYYSGTCGAVSSLGCISDMAFGNMPMSNLTPGTTYFVRLFMDEFSSAVSYELCLTDNTPPSNDEWAQATVLVQDAAEWCELSERGTFAGATNSQSAADCGGQVAVANDDVWYQFVAATENPIIEVEYFWGDYRVELFNADASMQLDCAQGTALAAGGLTISTNYLIRVFSANDQPLSAIEGEFSICVYGLPSSSISSQSNGSCLTIDGAVVSTGSNRWLHLNHQGELVAAVFDSEPLGALSTAYYQNTGIVRSTSGGIEYLDRNFSISPTSQPTSFVRVRFYYTQAELDALLASNDGDDNDITGFEDIVVSRFAGAACSESTAGNGELHFPERIGTLGSGYYIEILIDHFSGFFLHGGSRALPVQLIGFAGQQEQQAIRLHWTTESESANKGFAIERSTDGRAFSEIGWRNGQGTTTAPVDYTYLDQEVSPIIGQYYYRLRQDDYNGEFSYSSVISINYEWEVAKWSLYPNPAHEQLNLQFPRPVHGDVVLYNQLGQEVGHWELRGESALIINVQHLIAGGYWARVVDSERDLPVLQVQIR
ncbi:MAG: hypothetical protein AAFP77_17695 [Bacteroidota bacterium]